MLGQRIAVGNRDKRHRSEGKMQHSYFPPEMAPDLMTISPKRTTENSNRSLISKWDPNLTLLERAKSYTRPESMPIVLPAPVFPAVCLCDINHTRLGHAAVSLPPSRS